MRSAAYGIPCGVLISLAAFLGVWFWHAALMEAPALAYEDLSHEELKERFSAEIRATGSAAAYQQFSQSVLDYEVDRQHVFAHLFGDALWTVENMAGFSVCDERFQYACFHEMMGRAIAEHGQSIVPEVYKKCLQARVPRPFACLHGIGHGIISSTDYSEEGLDDALISCRDLPQTQNLKKWCYGGIFMEYNQRSMLGPEQARELGSAPEEKYEPCSSLGEEYKKACVFELPPWWLRVSAGSSSSRDSFARLGSYCERMPEAPALVRVCFEGLGNITTPETRYDARQSAALCEVATHNAEYQLFCKSTAALSLAAGPHQSSADAVCEGLIGDALHYCLLYAQKKANLTNPPEPPSFLE